jgi:hypothetical protein
VDAEAAGEVADALDGLFAALADDIGGAEPLRQLGSVGMAAQDEDLFGAEAPGSPSGPPG